MSGYLLERATYQCIHRPSTYSFMHFSRNVDKGYKKRQNSTGAGYTKRKGHFACVVIF